MKRKKTIFILAILMVLSLAINIYAPTKAAPLLEKKINFKIINKSDEVVIVHLKGPQNYDIEVLEEETKKVEIVKGDYTLEYTSCGDSYDDTLTLEDDFTMTIYACGVKPTKMRVKSHLPQKIVLKMDGPDDYKFTIKLGKTKVNLLSGWYVYSYDACGTTFSGEIRVTIFEFKH